MSNIEEKQQTIVEALRLGMPLGNVADYVGIPVDQIQQEMNEKPQFRAAIQKAIAECMYSRLTLLAKLQNWQALAFILESLWPTRFGRKSKGNRRRRTKRPSTKDDLDFNRLSAEEQDHLEHLLAKAHGRNRPRRSEAHVPVVRTVEPKLLS